MRRGQAMLEYILVTVSLIIAVSVLWGFVGVVSRSAERSENLVSSEYP